MLYVFEDNEAVIKMIIKGRSPTLRHGSRTELLLIGCVTGLIWILKSKIRCIDSKHQIADVLPKGNFTRDEWNNLLHLLNICLFQLHLLYQEFQLDKLLNNGEEDSKSKRRRKSCVQVATSSDEYVFFFIATCSSAASSPIASRSPGMPIASGKPDSRMSVEPSSFDAESTSQVRLKGAYLGGLMEEQRWDPSHQEEKIQKTQTVLQLEPGTTKKNLWPKTIKLGETPCTRSQFFSWPGKSKRYRSDMGPLPPNIARHRTTWKPSFPWSGTYMDELANKTTQQLYKVATPCMDDQQGRRKKKSRKIVYSLLTNCSDMSIFGSFW